MNQTPTQEKNKLESRPKEGQMPPAPQKLLRDPITLILFAVAALVVIVTFSFVCLVGCDLPLDPGNGTSGSTQPPVVDPSHDAVVYPTTPSRDNYLLNGNGTALDGNKISATSAILVSLDDYSVNASIDPDTRIYPASMTKIMTLVVACENLEDASVMLTVTKDIKNFCAKEGATVLALDPEDRFSATDMLYGVGIVSAADACLALADHICGSEEAFVAKMNEKAAALGLKNTHFANCTGLDDDENYSTVREMAIILAYALDNPFCKEILATDNRTVLGYYDKDGQETSYPRQLYNTIWSRLEGAGYEKKLPAPLSSGMTLLGGKTGFTDKGKYCLASFLEDKDGKLYIIVTAAGEKAATSVSDIDAIVRAMN